MPTFEFTSPEGKTYSVQGPDGATQEQAFGILQQHLGQSAPQIQPPSGGIGSQIYNAGKEAVSAIGEAFNPYSATNTARMNAERNASPFDISNEVGNLGTVAKGIMGVPQLASAPLTGLARGTIGRAYDALAPQFTPDQQAQLAASNVNLPSGNEVANTAMMGLRPTSATPAGIVTKSAPVPSAADLKQAYKDVRNSPAVKTATVPAQDVANFQAATTNDLVKAGYRPTTASAPGTFSELGNIVPPTGEPVQVDDLLAARQALSRYAGQTLEGKPTTEASAATRALRNLDSLIEQYAPQMKDANANYAAGMRADSFDLRGQKAQNNAAAANSGMNLENNLRTQVRQILNNPKLQRGYDAETLAAMRAFNSGSKTANVLRMVGNALGGGGGWGTVANAALGSVIGGPVGAVAVPATGMALKAAGNARALRQFDQLSQMIRANSPLARNAAPIPVSGPNPFLSGLAAGQLPQMFGLGLRPLLGVMPSPADQKQ